MSHVTDVLVCTMLADGGSQDDNNPSIDSLNHWLSDQYGPANVLKKIDLFAGGGKVMQCDVWGCAINACDISALVNQFRSIPWEFPESAQIMIKDEEWDKFRSYDMLSSE